MLVALSYEFRMDNDRRPEFEPGGEKQRRAAFDATAPMSPLMQRASLQPTEPVNYVLFLDGLSSGHNEATLIVFSLLLSIIPNTYHTEDTLTASLYEAATGAKVGVYRAETHEGMFVWLPLLPFAPVTFALMPGRKKTIDPLFEDVFAQLSQALAGRPLPPAVEPARIEIKREEEHVIQREIRVQ
jgi:hypothetical protein